MATLLPEGKQSFTDSQGAPLVGGKLYTYDAGTSTPRPTYADAAGAVPNTNPVILDARGEATIFWSGVYKVVLKNAADATIWTVDPVGSTDAATALRADLANPNNVALGDALVAMRQPFNGAVARTVHDKLQAEVSVKDFGAVGDGVTDDTAAFLRCIAFLQQNSDSRGGIMNVDQGHYKLTDTLVFTSYELLHNIIMRGAGPIATLLNFAGMPAGKDGISFGAGAHFGVEDLGIANATRHGIFFGATAGSTSYASLGAFRNLRIQGCSGSGIVTSNSYMVSMEDIWARNSGQNGFVFLGFHTSLSVRRCWAAECAQTGWFLNGVIYSSFSACGADTNGFNGYALQNCAGIVFNGCGAEGNGRDAVNLVTSTSSTAGMPAQTHNISGLIFNAFFAVGNNISSPGTYASFISASTADNRPIHVILNGCVSYASDASDNAVIAAGTSGKISIAETQCVFDTGVFQSGTVAWGGRRFSFTPVVLGSISSGTCSYSTRDGTYVVQDGTCTFTINVTWTGHTGTGNLILRGLPSVLSAAAVTPVTITAGDLTYAGSLGAYVQAGTVDVVPHTFVSNGAQGLVAVDPAALLRISGVYPIVV